MGAEGPQRTLLSVHGAEVKPSQAFECSYSLSPGFAGERVGVRGCRAPHPLTRRRSAACLSPAKPGERPRQVRVSQHRQETLLDD